MTATMPPPPLTPGEIVTVALWHHAHGGAQGFVRWRVATLDGEPWYHVALDTGAQAMFHRNELQTTTSTR